MEIFLIRLLQFVLAISLLVLLHEGGHFFFSKLFGVRVEKFYLFFDPWFHLFEWKPKRSETTYGIGWLPLGGYCKISGMIDESFDTEQMKQPVQPWEFRAKPAWQRLLIMIGGVLVNFLLALFIYAMVLFAWGDDYIRTSDMTMGMKFNNEAKALGFKDHDILLGTDRGAFEAYGVDVFREFAKAKSIEVLRNGQKKTIQLSTELNLLDMLKQTPQFMAPFMPAHVDSVIPGTTAARLNMQAGDVIMAVNGKNVDSYNEFQNEMGRLGDILAAAKTRQDSLRARHTTIMFRHSGSSKAYKAAVTLSEDLKFGFFPKLYADHYTVTHKSYGFLESIPAGIKYGWNQLRGYVGDLKYVASADGVKSLGGFGAIGSLFPATWNWHAFWLMT
ncbi:MAG: site-2 protease family protein, partial [Prevotella sp.]|nr:site-2 protease family protein [Prevotella sp.]